MGRRNLTSVVERSHSVDLQRDPTCCMMSHSLFTRRREISPPPFCFVFGNLFYSVRLLLLLPANRKSCAIARAIFKLSSYTWIVYWTMRLLVVFSPRYIPRTHARLPASSRRHAWRKRAKGGGLTNKVERGKESHTLSAFLFFPFYTGKHSLTRFPARHFLPPSWATSQTVFYFLSPTAICLVGLFRLLLVFIHTY
jgi:hypothetical protein